MDACVSPSVGKSVPEARNTQDFIGLNHYYSEQVKFDLARAGQLFGRSILKPWALKWKNTFGGIGNVEPRALELTLKGLARLRLPIYGTENGIFDMEDGLQLRYLVSHLASVHRAIQSGVPVKGYYWWTLVDNFELAEGYAPRWNLALRRNCLRTCPDKEQTRSCPNVSRRFCSFWSRARASR